MLNHKLILPRPLWTDMWSELNFKGQGIRETGGFLLGSQEEPKISKFISYDILDPAAFDSGIIVFNGPGYIPLWDICEKESLRVWADIHTHPYEWIGQSELDKSHPMISQKGHIGIILPWFATKFSTDLKEIGFYQYLGEYRWASLRKNAILIE